MIAVVGLVAACAAMPETAAVQDQAGQGALQRPLSDWAVTENITSAAIVGQYLDRIRADRSDGGTNAVLALNPNAMRDAAALDAARPAGAGPLYGLPILIKDNIETLDLMPTTAGSLALIGNITHRDSPLVARLRAAGMVVLGKANLSEWANIRDDKSTSGWSAVGGQTHNPHLRGTNPCGSSSGSAAAVAAGLAPAAIGTETDGSIVCPSAINGIVGFKPTVGLISRRYIVPISTSQDTAGPMTLTVRDAALLLSVMAGTDPADPATAEADARRIDYAAGLSVDGLQGLRIGVLTLEGTNAAVFGAAVARLAAAGAVLVPIAPDLGPVRAAGADEFAVLMAELRTGLAAYLGDLPANGVTVRSLADVIAFNRAHAALEMPYFGQSIFEQAEASTATQAEYLAARARSLRAAGVDGIDAWLAANDLDLIVAQTNGPAWRTTLGAGDAFVPPSASRAPAIAGYPHLTVPMGTVDGLPLGLSFIGPAWSDALVLQAGHAFEVAGPSLRAAP
jgi:amidase